MLPQRLRVLLIEDEPVTAKLMLHILKQSRSPSFVVIYEANLTDAVARIRMSTPFDVAMLDLSLPDSRGIDTVSKLQAAAPDLPIVVMTADDDPALAEQVLEVGAQDYLIKGNTSEQMVLRSIRYAITRKHADLERQAIADRLAFSLAEECQRMDADLSLARTMQFGLLPSPDRLVELAQNRGLAVQSFFEPSSEIGGDLWGCAEGEEGRTVFYTFDFSGHGVGAALNVFRLHALLSESGGRITDPAATLGRLNRLLVSLLPRGQYATIFLAVIDSALDRLTWSAGGAPRPILFDHEGNFQLLDTRGKPLGISAEARYVNRVLPFPQHSSLFVYSDVMTESQGDQSRELGEDGLIEMVRGFHSPAGIDIPGLVARFIDKVGSPMDDDMTAISITRLVDQAPLHRTTAEAARAAAFAPLILTSRRLDAIATGLAPPYSGFIEIAPTSSCDAGPACVAAAERGGICLSLTVHSAWSCGIVGLLCNAIRRRYGGERDWDTLDLCLSEAISNAIIHGGLGIKSGLRETKDGLEQFNDAVRLRLADPAYADKRIEITVLPRRGESLEVAIYDQGRGYDFERQLTKAVSPGAKHGRGLALIHKTARSVESRDGGRTLVMTF